MNAFESGSRKIIPAVLIYARSPQGILMLHRNKQRAQDYHDGKWNGLGGKLDPDESAQKAAQREFFEESGIQLVEDKFKCLGFLQFPNFKSHKSEDWLVFVFTVECTPEQVSHLKTDCVEGTLHWVTPERLEKLNLWEGDRHFLPYVIERKPFYGTIWYEGEKCTRAEITAQ